MKLLPAGVWAPEKRNAYGRYTPAVTLVLFITFVDVASTVFVEESTRSTLSVPVGIEPTAL